METIVERIKLLIDEYFRNQKKFAEILEIHPGTVNRWFNKEGISLEMINKIVNAVPDLNTEWLIRGEGEIFKKEDKDGKIIHEPGKMHIGKNTMRLRFNKIRKRLNLPESYMLYSFKHTGNSAAVDAGISAYERMMQNGHTSIRTTEIYTKNKIGFQSEDIRQNFPKL